MPKHSEPTEYWNLPDFDRKSFDAYILETKQEGDQGVVDAIVSVFGNVDEGADIVHPGSFSKTLQERGGKVKVLDNHNTDSTEDAIASIRKIGEVKRAELPPELRSLHPDATGGLRVQMQFMLDNPYDKSYKIYQRIKAGIIDQYSFGFQTIKEDFSKMADTEQTVRNIREVKLWEVSPVIFAMNEATVTAGVKSATSFQNIPLASRSRAWDSGAAESRVRSWAGGGKESIDWAKYRRAFLWYDNGDAQNFRSYKLPYADIINGELTAIPRGIFAAAAAIGGSRGGVDVGGDTDAVKRLIDRWYKRMASEFNDDGIVSPWNKGADDELEEKEQTPDGPVQRFGDILRAQLHRNMSAVADDWLFFGSISTGEHDLVLNLMDGALNALVDGLPEDLALRTFDVPMGLFNNDARTAEPEQLPELDTPLTPTPDDIERRRKRLIAEMELEMEAAQNGYHSNT